MAGDTEIIGINSNRVINLNSLKQHPEWGIGEVINIDSELLAAVKWPEMIDLTQQDEIERGVVVSWDGKRILTSKIFLGTKGSFTPPELPHGFLSLLPTTKNLVFIHSHYMPPEIGHVQTTPISDGDINSFADFSGKAMVMIDRGGVHILTRKLYNLNVNGPSSPINVVDEAITKAKSNGNTAMDIIREIARRLEPFGIKYYYSPSLVPSNGSIELKTVSSMPT